MKKEKIHTCKCIETGLFGPLQVRRWPTDHLNYHLLESLKL